jgi:hypothetical protein
MSRWTPYEPHDRDQDRATTETADFQISRGVAGTEPTRHVRFPGGARDQPREREEVTRPLAPQQVPLRELANLIAGDRQLVLSQGGRGYALSSREVRALGTIGAFRAVPVGDLTDRDAVSTGELSHLGKQGLVRIDAVGLRGDTRQIATITDVARDLLESHSAPSPDRSPQAFHAGLVKPAEVAHDGELFALYEIVADDIQRRGGVVERVVLDYELKADYQSFLNRADRSADASLEVDRAAWASAHHLQLVEGELRLPDFRVEYRDADGGARHQDVEYATRHYSAKAIAAKARAGFAVYRRAGAPRSARVADRPLNGRGGQAPDPRLFERLL